MACYDVDPNICTYDSQAAEGKDYTSLDAWEGDTDVDITGYDNPTQLQCYDSQTHSDYVTNIAGATTDPTHYRQVCAASGETPVFEHDGDDNEVISVSEDYARFYDLSIKKTDNSTSSKRGFYGPNFGKACRLKIYECVNSGSGIFDGMYSAAISGYVVACLVRDSEDEGFQAAGSSFYNCTSVDNGGAGFDETTGTNVVYNCVAFNNSGAGFDTGWDAASDYNASDDDTEPGANSPATDIDANDFVDHPGDDFHIRDTNATIYQTGNNASGTHGETTDLDGVTFGAGLDCSIGCYEYVAGGAANAPTGGIFGPLFGPLGGPV